MRSAGVQERCITSTFKVCGVVAARAGALVGAVAGCLCVATLWPLDADACPPPEWFGPALLSIDFMPGRVGPDDLVSERDCWVFVLYEDGRIDYGDRWSKEGLRTARIHADTIEMIRQAVAKASLAERCGDAGLKSCSSTIRVVATWEECAVDAFWSPRRDQPTPCDEAYETVRVAAKAAIGVARDVRPHYEQDPRWLAVESWIRDQR